MSYSMTHREEVDEYDSFTDIYISDTYEEHNCLGEVYLEGFGLAHADENTEVKTSVMFTIYKESANNEKGLVSGWANVAKNADGSIPLDWQGDIIAPSELEDAAVDFMLKYRESGEMHQGDAVGTVVESIVLTKDKQAAMGIPEGIVPEGWFITVKVSDESVLAKIKDGTYKMFSIQGTAERVAV